MRDPNHDLVITCLKAMVVGIFLICAVYAVATQVYHVSYTPLPAGGADVAP